MLNAVSVFNQMTPGHMAEEQSKDPILRVVCPYVTAREKFKSSVNTKIKTYTDMLMDVSHSDCMM